MLDRNRNRTTVRRFRRIAVCLLFGLLGTAPGFAPAAAAGLTAAAPLELSPKTEARCLDVLRSGLKSDEFWPSMHAAEGLTLAAHGEEVRAVLKPRLSAETDDQRRCGLAREIVRAGDVFRVDVLLDVLGKDDPYAHIHAAESLYKVGRIGDGRLLRAALERRENPILQVMAAAALGRCGSPAAMQLVRRKLDDEDVQVSRIAAWVLGRLGEPSDVEPVRENLDRAEDAFTRCFFEHALAALGDAAGREALRRNLSADDARIRALAAVFAGESGMRSAASRLTSMLDDPNEDVRIRAAQSLFVLARPPARDPRQDICVDVYPATDEHPRITEGSIIGLRDGALLYAVSEFIRGTGDAAAAHIVARRSSDGGRTWEAKRVLQENVGQRNVMSVTLRRLPRRDAAQHPIGMFYLVKNSLSDLKVYLRISPDEGRTFGDPIRVTDAPGYHVMNNDRVTILSTDRVIAPVAWTPDIRKRNHLTAFCYYSDDGGRTWQRGRREVDMPRRGAMEPDVLELRDGRLVMILRNQLGYIAASYSDDGGHTWSEPVRWDVRAPEAPATLRRIPATGDLLLVWNNNYEPGAGHSGRRTPLSAAISRDEGATWTNVRNLESRTDRMYSYTSLIFVGPRAVMSYYVRDEKTGRLSSRFRSLPVRWFYESGKPSVR